MAARKAIELDETSSEGRTALAMLLLFDFKFAPSEQEFRRAIELNPNYATAHHWFGNSLLVTLGRFDEAIKEGQRAVELDPLSLIINADLGSTLMIARRYDDAIAQLRKTLVLDGNFAYAHWNLGEALYLKEIYMRPSPNTRRRPPSMMIRRFLPSSAGPMRNRARRIRLWKFSKS